jgi:hypothetical protein
MTLAAEMAYGLRQLIAVQGGPIVLRKITTLAGANPAPNPPVFDDLVVDGTLLAGVTAIDMRANPITGRLVAGDRFQLGDMIYTVVGPGAISPTTRDELPGVPFTPALAAPANDGDPVTIVSFAADTPLRALVTDFPSRLVSGETVTEKDHQVRFLAADLPAGVEPQIGDEILLQGGAEPAKIIGVSHLEIQGVHYGWACHVRA